SPITNSLLLRPSRASFSSTACDTAKSPALAMRWNCLCSSACPAARERKENDWVSSSGNGADSRRLYIPTTLGVGYSLIPSIAPARALGAPGARAREQPGGQPRGEARERAVQHREIDVVDHQRFGGEPLAISRGEDVDESASGGGGDRGALGTADHMRPQRDVGTGEVAPQHVQPLVPAVQLLIVGALEAGAAETEGLQVVSGAGPDHAGRHVGGVGNVLGGRVLPLQRLLSPRAQHDAALRPGGAIGTTGADLRRPSPRGRSSVNGL